MSSPERVRVVPAALAVAVAVAAVVLTTWARRGDGGGGPAAPVMSGPTTVFTDDFSSRRGWATFSSETAGLSYHDGAYRLQLFRPGDDGRSAIILPGSAWRSVAATVSVEARSRFGGLVGVGCAAGKGSAYLGAVDPAGSGYVILRASRASLTLLRSGADDQGVIRGAQEENELQIQCTLRSRPRRDTWIRLYANGRLLATYQDPGGYGPFNGMMLAGISLRRPLDAAFSHVRFQSLSPTPNTARSAACDGLALAGSVEEDYRWLVDSGGTRLNTPDFEARRVRRIARELIRTARALRGAARGLPADGVRSVPDLADRLLAQGDALNSLTNSVNRQWVDVSSASSGLGCRATAFVASDRMATRAGRLPAAAKVSSATGMAQEDDASLTRALPAPAFVADPAPPVDPEMDAQVDFRYGTFRVFGDSIAKLNHSLRVNAIHLEGELAAAVTFSRFELSYDPLPGGEGSGCILVPHVALDLLIKLPEWTPPATADRYLRNQWNQFMWDLDAHERHHAELWIKAANNMLIAINGTPPEPSCRNVVDRAKVRVARTFKRFDGMQKRFDRDVAAGTLPGPSLP